ncbi:MAG: dihydropteroate synthase [Phycisphaerales bacterium]|nr:dihydropteroate synthase [Phycisphaerales bacterium]
MNITEDSFSDGGKYLDFDKAVAHGHALMEAGADVLDVGPASSHPNSKPVSAEEEIERVTPVLGAFAAAGIPVSIDTFQTETQRYALSQGVAYLNDIQGFADPGFYPELADAQAKLVVMHAVQQRGPAALVDTSPAEIWGRIERFFDDRLAALEQARINRNHLILDPGMGFFLGTDMEVSFQVLRNLGRLRKRYDLPILVSVSRKSFLRKVTGRPLSEMASASLATELFVTAQGADFIRTHDPAALRDGLKIWSALGQLPPIHDPASG